MLLSAACCRNDSISVTGDGLEGPTLGRRSENLQGFAADFHTTGYGLANATCRGYVSPDEHGDLNFLEVCSHYTTFWLDRRP